MYLQTIKVAVDFSFFLTTDLENNKQSTFLSDYNVYEIA